MPKTYSDEKKHLSHLNYSNNVDKRDCEWSPTRRFPYAQGQRYNPNNYKQEFVYDLAIDANNNLSGSVIQNNQDSLKEWCGYLKVTILDKNKKVLDVFMTTPHKLESIGQSGVPSTFQQKVIWKLKNPKESYSIDLAAVPDCSLLKKEK